MSTLTRRSEIVKTNRVARNLAGRLDRLWQSRNERVARADADYFAAAKRAVAEVEQGSEEESAAVVEHPGEGDDRVAS